MIRYLVLLCCLIGVRSIPVNVTDIRNEGNNEQPTNLQVPSGTPSVGSRNSLSNDSLNTSTTELPGPGLGGVNSSLIVNPSKSGDAAPRTPEETPSTEKPTTTTTKSTTIRDIVLGGDRIYVEQSRKSEPCMMQFCDRESKLIIAIEPIGNQTGYISRAVGLPVTLRCFLLTKGREMFVPLVWKLPNGTEVISTSLAFSNVNLNDTGLYECRLEEKKCCSTPGPLKVTVHMSVYELNETTGIILMLSVLLSIAVLVSVFIYSQKKKRYHSWLKHEILAASSNSTTSTLNRDQQNTSKKYLITS